MAETSEQELAVSLAKAVENYMADNAEAGVLTSSMEEGLDNLLYGHGGDGVLELSVSEIQAKSITIVGVVIWVADQTLGPLEATFQRGSRGVVEAATIRAGDRRRSPRDGIKYPPQSWRKLLRMIDGRPQMDEEWSVVLRYVFE